MNQIFNMPFKSKAQMKYMFDNMPQVAKLWAEHTKNIKKLPKKKKNGK